MSFARFLTYVRWIFRRDDGRFTNEVYFQVPSFASDKNKSKPSRLVGRFLSLRDRLLFPLVLVALVAAAAIAIASYWLGNRRVENQLESRFQTITEALGGATFPLNSQVIELLTTLINAELITLEESGTVAGSSLAGTQTPLVLSDEFLAQTIAPTSELAADTVTVAGDQFRFGVFKRGGPGASSDDVDRVVVLFDANMLQESRMRAAAIPLITGLSTVFLLTAIALFFTGRMVRRLSRLCHQVDQIAEGNFDVEITPGANDEIGLLADGVSRMSFQLSQMWKSLNRRQGEKLLHQIAGGLAHQLRNSLTGARMAVELHHNKCSADSDRSLHIAISQLEQTEDSVRRLLLVAAGKQDEDRPALVAGVVQDVRETLGPQAKHLRVALDWTVNSELDGLMVSDGPSLAAALSNLLLNAIQAASQVRVEIDVDDGVVLIEVIDNGPGPPAEIADNLFEPFVTSKPEGLGLGLPLVSRAAARLGGQVKWERIDNETRFQLTVVTKGPSLSNEQESKSQ